MLTLHQFPGPWDVCSGSCFCAKVEAFLKWQKIPHHVVSKVTLKGAPKGKVPFIVDEDGVYGDSDFIIAHLCEKYEVQPDAGLSPAQLGQARAIRYLCEEGLYRAMSYFRFVNDEGWEILRKEFFADLPGWIRPIAEWRVRGYVRNQLKQQGIGRHTPIEIAQLAQGDLRALSDMLGEQTFFFGERMHMVDLVVFSVVSNLIVPPFDDAVTRRAKMFSNLVAHTDRVREACFGGVTMVGGMKHL